MYSTSKRRPLPDGRRYFIGDHRTNVCIRPWLNKLLNSSPKARPKASKGSTEWDSQNHTKITHTHIIFSLLTSSLLYHPKLGLCKSRSTMSSPDVHACKLLSTCTYRHLTPCLFYTCRRVSKIIDLCHRLVSSKTQHKPIGLSGAYQITNTSRTFTFSIFSDYTPNHNTPL